MSNSDDAQQMADVIEQVEISNIELNKLRRIAKAAELIVKDYWVTTGEDDAKAELRKAVLDYLQQCEYYV